MNWKTLLIVPAGRGVEEAEGLITAPNDYNFIHAVRGNSINRVILQGVDPVELTEDVLEVINVTTATYRAETKKEVVLETIG